MVNQHEFKLNESLSKHSDLERSKFIYIKNPIYLENYYRELVNIWGKKEDERGVRDQDRSFIGLWNVSFSPLSCDPIRRACVQGSAV